MPIAYDGATTVIRPARRRVNGSKSPEKLPFGSYSAMSINCIVVESRGVSGFTPLRIYTCSCGAYIHVLMGVRIYSSNRGHVLTVIGDTSWPVNFNTDVYMEAGFTAVGVNTQGCKS